MEPYLTKTVIHTLGQINIPYSERCMVVSRQFTYQLLTDWRIPSCDADVPDNLQCADYLCSSLKLGW